VHNTLLEYVRDADVVEERGGFSCIAGLGRRARSAPLARIERISEAAVETIARYLHPSIADRLRAGQSGFLNEHRKVTALFVNFGGFDYDHDQQVGAKLQAYLVQVIQTIQRYDGYLNKVDMGDKGSKYIVQFGAPLAHEDDEERAIRCALDLRKLGVTVRIG